MDEIYVIEIIFWCINLLTVIHFTTVYHHYHTASGIFSNNLYMKIMTDFINDDIDFPRYRVNVVSKAISNKTKTSNNSATISIVLSKDLTIKIMNLTTGPKSARTKRIRSEKVSMLYVLVKNITH